MARRVTTTDLLDAIRANLTPPGRPEGDGWYTADEVAQQLKLRIGAARTRLRTMVENGTAIAKIGTVIDGHGIARRTNYYRIP